MSTGERPTIPAHFRSVVSYVQRGERMTTGQQRAWDQYWPEMGRTISELDGPLDFNAWFGRRAPVLLEIGSGMGDATAELAAAAPEINHVAVEVYKPGHGQLLLHAERLGLTNLRLLRGDAMTLLERHIAADSLSGIRLFFPDPWPKSRHHKRRLVRPDVAALMASRLIPGHMLHMATDWADYAEQMLAVCSAVPTLRNRYHDWAPRPDWRPVTKFERRAHAEGRDIRDLMFDRV